MLLTTSVVSHSFVGPVYPHPQFQKPTQSLLSVTSFKDMLNYFKILSTVTNRGISTRPTLVDRLHFNCATTIHYARSITATSVLELEYKMSSFCLGVFVYVCPGANALKFSQSQRFVMPKLILMSACQDSLGFSLPINFKHIFGRSYLGDK